MPLLFLHHFLSLQFLISLSKRPLSYCPSINAYKQHQLPCPSGLFHRLETQMEKPASDRASSAQQADAGDSSPVIISMSTNSPTAFSCPQPCPSAMHSRPSLARLSVSRNVYEKNYYFQRLVPHPARNRVL